jgi:hypothetical protein
MPSPTPYRPPRTISFLDRIVLVIFGALLAAIAAMVFAIIGLANHNFGQDLASFAEAMGLRTLSDILTGERLEDIGVAIRQGFTAALAIWLAPIALVAVIGEAMGRSGWMFYAIGMALAFALAPMAMSLSFLTILVLYHALLGLLAIGVVAGTVYWLVAGRGAGMTSS